MSDKKKTRPYFVEFCGQKRCIEAKSREAAREHLIAPILPSIEEFSIPDATELGRFMAGGGRYEIAGKTIDSLDRVIVALTPADAALIALLSEDFKKELLRVGSDPGFGALHGNVYDAEGSRLLSDYFAELSLSEPASPVRADSPLHQAFKLGQEMAEAEERGEPFDEDRVAERLDEVLPTPDHSPDAGNMPQDPSDWPGTPD